MPDRIRVRFRDLDMTTLTPAEAASSEFIQINLGMVGCSDCKLASLCNEVGLTVKVADKFEHMIIEASELKRDMQKNAGRQVAEGIDLSKSRESVDVWSATKALLYPILSPVLEDTEAVYGCTNCPTPLTYEFEDLIEYTPDDPM